MWGKILKSFAASALLAPLSACGGGAPSVLISSTKAPPSRAELPVLPTPGADGAAASVLRFAQGKWIGSCQADSFSSPYRLSISFSGLLVTEESSIYQDSGCDQLLSTWSRKLAVVSVHSFPPQDENNLYGFDLSVNAREVLMTTFGGYGALADQVCGLRSWTDGVARDVSGRDCGPGRQETTGADSVLYFEHDPVNDELVYQDETLKRQ